MKAVLIYALMVYSIPDVAPEDYDKPQNWKNAHWAITRTYRNLADCMAVQDGLRRGIKHGQYGFDPEWRRHQAKCVPSRGR
jgi:hypothetical protein